MEFSGCEQLLGALRQPGLRKRAARFNLWPFYELWCTAPPTPPQFLGAITTTNSLRGPAIVTELAARGNLSEVMANTPMSDSQLFKMAADIARGMLYLHELKPRPIVHRDLKPGE